MTNGGNVIDYYSANCTHTADDPHFSMEALLIDGESGKFNEMMKNSIPDTCGSCDSEIDFQSENITWPSTVALTVEKVKDTFSKTNGYVCLKIDIEKDYEYMETTEEQLTFSTGEILPLPLGEKGTYYLTKFDDEYHFCNSNGDSPPLDEPVNDELITALLNRYKISPVSIDRTPLLRRR